MSFCSLSCGNGLLVARLSEPPAVSLLPCVVGQSNTVAFRTSYSLEISLFIVGGALLQKLATRNIRLSRLKQRSQKGLVHGPSDTHNFLIRESPGKGLGAFATRNVSPGALIISEAPLLRIERPFHADKICKAVTSLHPEARRHFWSLFDKEPEKSAEGIFTCNYFEMDGDGGVYKTICRFNHSCVPNCVHFFGGERPLGELRAVRPLLKGEELTVAYIGLCAPRRARRAELRRIFGFACGCRACAAADPDSDRRRGALHELDARLAEAAAAVRAAGGGSEAGGVEARAEGLRLIPELLRLVAEEGLTSVEELDARACATAVFLLAGHPERQAYWAGQCVARYGLCGSREEVAALRGQLEDIMAEPPQLPPIAPALLEALALVESAL